MAGNGRYQWCHLVAVVDLDPLVSEPWNVQTADVLQNYVIPREKYSFDLRSLFVSSSIHISKMILSHHKLKLQVLQ